MNAIFERMAEATGARTQEELAAILSIRQSSISDAKRRGSLPDAWLVKLLDLYALNPAWVKTGRGSKRLVPDSPSQTASGTALTPDVRLAELIGKIAEAVMTAREKHPRFAGCPDEAYRAVLSEHLEWQSQAMLISRADGRMNTARLEKAEAESLDCIATHIRFLLREYPPFNQV